MIDVKIGGRSWRIEIDPAPILWGAGIDLLLGLLALRPGAGKPSLTWRRRPSDHGSRCVLRRARDATEFRCSEATNSVVIV